jgi:hypothetical protein
VHPEAIAYVDDTAVGSAKVENSQLNATYSFKLPVPTSIAASGEKVTVTHKASGGDVNLGEFTVDTDGYVTITGITSFSEFELVKDTGITSAGNASYAASLTLKDNIDINLYVSDLATGTDPEKYTVTYTFNGVETTKSLTDSSVTNNGGVYKLKVAQVYSYQMTLPVSFVVKYDGTPIATFTYSVQTYFTNKLSSTDANLVALCKAGLDYGANAQLYFNGKSYVNSNNQTVQYQTDSENLANKTTNPSNTITATQPNSSYPYSASGSVVGFAFDSASLILGSETSIKVYFSYSGDVSALTFAAACESTSRTVGDVRSESGGLYSVKITGIKSFELNKTFTLTVNGNATLTYSPFAYARNKWNNTGNLGNLCKALVNYGSAANAYFGL